MCAALVLLVAAAPVARLPDFRPTAFHNEQQREFSPEKGVRAVANAPGDFDPNRPTRLVIYACPNGNSIEMTMGAKLEKGMDWHYDIQHIAAQTRKLRQIDADENIVVAVLEADTKSWPAWRNLRGDENGKLIREVVEQVQAAIFHSCRVSLAGHSGGGSFIFGYLNGGDAIPDEIERIAWLDANYAYDNEKEQHGDKLLAWLKGDSKRHLIVFAYDDFKARLNGKPFVSATGGTFYRSHKMVEFFNAHDESKLTQTQRGPFEEYVGMNGQIHFLLHTNPEAKILHTILVERNGLLEAMTWDTPLHDKWGGQFWGDRAYSDLIAPSAIAATRPATRVASGIPARPEKSLGGNAFAETIADLPPKAREAAIIQEIVRGNIPEFQRKFCTVRAGRCTYQVMPDYLAIGSDDDYVRMPMTPASAQAIADVFGCSLPTRKMVNDIYAAAEVKLEPKPLTEQREAVRTFVQHNQIIQEQLGGKPPGKLVAGDKKDVVISNRLKEKPNRVAIYGWHKLDGKPIQPLYVGHGDFYADYSHGIRLVKREVLVDGKARDIGEVLKDPKLCELLSDEGPIEPGAATYEAGH